MILKDSLFSVFFCIYVYWPSLMFAILGEKGMELDGGLMRTTLSVIFAVSFLFFLSYGISKREIKIMSILALFAILYYTTRYFYSSGNIQGYQGQFLRWGADCVSACLIGISLMKLKSYKLVHRLMPLLSIALTPLFVKSTMKNAFLSGQMHLESGMNYQTMAYTLAVMFCISLYYAIVNKEYSNRLIRIASLLCLPFQSVACCMSGGRGGVVLLVVYIVVMLYLMQYSKIASKKKVMFIALLGFCVFIITANHLDLWKSAGFNRSSGLVQDQDRYDLWKKIWVYVENNNYMGYGLGGDYFTFGFYTHNILLDFILETGIVGCVFLISIFINIYKTIFKKCTVDNIFILLAIIGIYGVVMNLFSGYWITTYAHWMMLGASVTSKKRFVLK